MQEITNAFLDFAADPSVSMTFHVEREKLERLLDTAHVVARFYATNLVWEGFGVGSSFPHDESDEAGEGEGAAKKAKIDNREAIQWHKRFCPIFWAICGPFLMLMLKYFIQVGVTCIILFNLTLGRFFNPIELTDDSDNLATLARPSHLAMPYTVEEEAWLRSSLDRFSAAYNEVSLGEEFRNEFVMFSYDVPLSKRFV